jgi:hypothetical protein
LRRSLSIPNPLHQSMLVADIAANWIELRDFCARSPLALSVPTLSGHRALLPREDLSRQPFHRVQRSIGSRYLLKTDIARFYSSIYTHSIPWALHGKTAARADTKYALLGNRLDLWMRETQDKQTGGIPIGPDTSFLIGEVIGASLDLDLQTRIPRLRGTRSIDDYYLYFDTVAEAEHGLAALHGAARDLELEINDPKTEVLLMPDTLEPLWKGDLRGLNIRPKGQPQATDLLSLFDRAFEHSRQFPSDSVLTYAAKQVLSASISEENWKFCEALLLKASIAEPTMLSVLVDIYDTYSAYHTDNVALANALLSICWYHAPLQQGNEVAWALWLAKKMGVTIPESVADKIAYLDDDIVALISLDLRDGGLFHASHVDLWSGYMDGAYLYEDHWLLAYEAHEHNWLPPWAKNNYVGADDFFSILQSHDVKFYGSDLVETSSYFDYSQDEEADEAITNVEGDNDLKGGGSRVAVT